MFTGLNSAMITCDGIPTCFMQNQDSDADSGSGPCNSVSVAANAHAIAGCASRQLLVSSSAGAQANGLCVTHTSTQSGHHSLATFKWYDAYPGLCTDEDGCPSPPMCMTLTGLNYGHANAFSASARSFEFEANCTVWPTIDWEHEYTFDVYLDGYNESCACSCDAGLSSTSSIVSVRFVSLGMISTPQQGSPTTATLHRVVAVNGDGDVITLGFPNAPSVSPTFVSPHDFDIEVVANDTIAIDEFTASILLIQFEDAFGRHDDDINRNGSRDWQDRMSFAVALGSVLGDEHYTPRADYDLDGDVDEDDRDVFLLHVNTRDGNLFFPASYDVNVVMGCTFDVDDSGFLDGDDYDYFIALYTLGDPLADTDASGFVDGDDFDAFMIGFVNGEC